MIEFGISKKKSYIQLMFRMVANGEGCYYIAVKQLHPLVRGKISKHNDYSYVLKCINSFRTKDKLESHKKC